jgi:hypothetical protein
MHDAVERWKTSGFVFLLPCKSISSIDGMILGWMGGQEVRVQFLGFGSEDYQWVSIKNAVWQRSFPCETIKACGCSSW